MSLENLLKARNPKKSGVLVPLINEHLLLEAKKPSGRRTGVFHPSEISGFFCPRQWVIKERHRAELAPEEILPGSMRTFEIGHRLHDMMQAYLSDMGLMFGHHKCKGCHTEHYGFKPEVCGARLPNNLDCNSKKFKYNEVVIDDPEYHIGGHTDGVIVIGDMNALIKKPKKYIFEFKTINPRGYENLRKEIDDHREQASIYMVTLDKQRQRNMETLRAQGLEDSDQYRVEELPFEGVILLYMNKGMQPADGTQDLKEYFVPFEEGHQVVEAKYPILDETWAHFEAGTYPNRVCKGKTEGHKCRCPKAVIGYCFDTLKD